MQGPWMILCRSKKILELDRNKIFKACIMNIVSSFLNGRRIYIISLNGVMEIISFNNNEDLIKSNNSGSQSLPPLECKFFSMQISRNPTSNHSSFYEYGPASTHGIQKMRLTFPPGKVTTIQQRVLH